MKTFHAKQIGVGMLMLGLNAAPAVAATAPLNVVAAENEYADVAAQIGGKDVHVTAIESDPNTDPHSFEISPSVARRIGGAVLIITNGIGYDEWANRIIAATPNKRRELIDVQTLLGLPDGTPNPHLWYDPKTMPAVAAAVATDLSALAPSQAAYFAANRRQFVAALAPWTAAIAAFRHDDPGTPVAVTEPVGDYMLQAAGTKIATPFSLQAAIMNGTDPTPQDVTLQNRLFTDHKVKILVYNQQVTDPLTQSFLILARQNHVPVVGVYETMPLGYHYQDWMLAEVTALRRAVADGVSTVTLAQP